MKINLIEYFEDTARQYSDKIAVVDQHGQLTFQQIKDQAQAIGTKISKVTGSLNGPVALFFPKSSEAVLGILGTLYSGNCYAPMDVKSPVARINSILKVLKPSCIITNNTYLDKVLSCRQNIEIINIDALDRDNQKDVRQQHYLKCIDTDPAYIIHTSGSTGIPKGVAISHRSVIDYIEWAAETFNITSEEVIGNQAPLTFDNSTLDIYLMVFKGATLDLIPEMEFMFPAKLLDYIEAHHINFVFWVPSVLVNVSRLKVLDKIKVPSLRKVLFAGEVMPTKHLNYWIDKLDKGVLFANLYGPTEITVDCTYYIVDREFKDDELIPIGKPCRDTDVLILNEADRLCARGEHGELCVRGSSLALGYWNNFEKTDAVFIQNPLNSSYPEKIYRTGDIVYQNDRNEIVFTGRKDFQIKHLGYRIELGEVEHAIQSVFRNITPCVVYNNRANEIVLIYESDTEISIQEFRVELSRVLPKYMMPTQYLRIDHLPLSTSGKLDRKSLTKNVNDENSILW